MNRPKAKLIVKRAKVEIDSHWRDRFDLECGHTIDRALRKGKAPRRVVCLRCDP